MLSTADEYRVVSFGVIKRSKIDHSDGCLTPDILRHIQLYTLLVGLCVNYVSKAAIKK